MNKKLENEIELLPESPGVYLMYNVLNTIIYVGKAKNLRKRVAQYFLRDQVGKVARMVREADHFETIQTESEKEALLLEINLIRKHYPRFNILLKDGKTYPFIALKKDKAPFLKIMHNDNDKSYKYFGPFPNSGACYEVIDLLNKIYPLRKCKTLPNKPCLYYHLGQCLAPCINDIDEETFEKISNQIELFLDGKDNTKQKEIYNLMIQESNALNFEKAAEYKKILDSIEHVVSKQNVHSVDNISRDIFAISSRDSYLCLYVLTYRKGILLGKEAFIVEQFGDIHEQMIELIGQYYQNHKAPKEVIISSKECVDSLNAILDSKVLSYSSGPKMELLSMAIKNAKAALDEHFQTARLEDDKMGLLEQLGKLLNINTPLHIELFDNSHIQGSNAIGGMVCFINGEKAKSMYRKFNIQHYEKRDDYASMTEIIKRRYKRLKEENKPFPDLILVDGGLGQIHAAQKALEELNIEINLAGLYKNNKHLTEGLMDKDGNKYIVENKSPLFFFLMRMQDEVHRYAITFHRELRSKGMFSSIFDDIEGLGKVRKEMLLARYPTIKDIQNATLEELSQILPLEVAKRVKEKVQQI